MPLTIVKSEPESPQASGLRIVSSAPDEGPSLGGFLSNVATDAGDVVSGAFSMLNPANWDDAARGLLDANRSKRAVEEGSVDSFLKPQPAFESGIDRIGAQFQQAGDDIYERPVTSTLEATALPIGRAVPGIIAAAPKVAKATAQGARSTAAGTAGFVARHPTAPAMLAGAAPGIMSGHPGWAAAGAYAGFKEAPAMGRRFGRLEKQLRGSDMPSPAAPRSATPSDSLTRELMARDIDWRTTDAVPIDAIKRDVSRGGSIIEAGESRVGLAERMAETLKAKRGQVPTPEQMAEALRLAAALRQRMHISAKSGR